MIKEKSMKNKKAFTLIELLVVISIIALLLSILMPALKMVREQGRRVICIANQKQMVLAIDAYANEYEGWYPVINDGIDLTDVHRYDSPPGWKGIDATLILTNFIESPGLFQCPSDNVDFGPLGGSYTDALGQVQTERNRENYRTYGYNLNYYGWASRAHGVGGWRKRMEMKTPQKTVLITETPSQYNVLYFTNYNVQVGPTPPNKKTTWGITSGYSHWPGYDIYVASNRYDPAANKDTFIHKQGCNYGFSDCHAEYIKVDIEEEWPPFSWFDNGLYKHMDYPDPPVW
jgi:prepilin-type N-terminal cleavage/methylation domain-containing protein